MQTRDALVQLLTGLSARTGLAGLGLDRTGVCALSFDDAAVLHITAEEESGSVLFYARVAEVERRLTTYRQLLVANAHGGHLGTLAIDERDDAVLLVHRVPAHALSDAEFERMVEGLAAAAMHWSAELAAPAATAPDTRLGDSSMPAFHFAIRG